jgi:probable HAF family extracellular repeat protein
VRKLRRRRTFFYELTFPLPRAAPYRIRDDGAILGNYTDTTTHGFLYQGGQITSIDCPGSISTFAYGINKTGAIVGACTDSNTGVEHGFLFRNNTYTPIDPTPAATVGVWDVNESLEFAGQAETPSGSIAFAIRYPTFATIPAPGGAVATGINTIGEIVGVDGLNSIGPDGSLQGFLYAGKKLYPISFPGAAWTEPQGINDRGHIAGYMIDAPAATGATHGFVLESGQYLKIDYPGASDTLVRGINNEDQLVGQYYVGNSWHSFFATPAR